MENKTLINKLKNAAELAQAAYGYYDLMTSDTNPLFIKLKNENSQANSNEDFSKKETTLIDIMDSSYKNYEVYFFNPKTKKEKKWAHSKAISLPHKQKDSLKNMIY